MNNVDRKTRPVRGRYKSSDETRERIIEAAEAVFASEGLHVSMRKIMDAAGVNVSSINYHFGDRDALLRAILDERSQSINKDRLCLLDAAVSGSEPPSVTAVIDALMRPALGPDRRRDARWRHFLKVRAMLSAESSAVVREGMSQNYDQMHTRFVDALAVTAPHLSREDIYWRYHCVLGVQSQSTALGYRINSISGGMIDVDKPDEMLDQIVPLMVKLFE